MKLSRTQNAKRNIAFGLINKIVTLLFPFIIRMVMIREIGAEYLGLGSLFSSILQVLNITELGFSSAVVYSMYKPIADDDTDTLCAILNFYRKMYICIGTIIALLGIILIPFLHFFINGTVPDNINIYVLYVMYLSSSVISYLLFAYKNSLISAYQRADVISNINTVIQLFVYIAQCIILITIKNYYLYVVMLFFGSILQNIFTEITSKRLFPKIRCIGNLSSNVRREIQIKVKGLLINKLCAISRNSFDSIFLSSFLGLTATAIYNNYFYIMNGITIMFSIIGSSILAGVGNSVATESQQKNYSDMKKFNFIYMGLASWSTVCLLCLYQPFTELAFGKEMLFPFPVVTLFCIYFYVLRMGDIRALYSEAKGLWWENRFRAVTEAVLNIVLNFILGKLFGVYGIVAATLISLFFINFIWGSTIIYKYYFTEIKMREYYLLHLLYATVTIVVCFATYFVCSKVLFVGILGFLVKLLLCSCVSAVILVITYSKFPLFKLAKMWMVSSFFQK